MAITTKSARRRHRVSVTIIVFIFFLSLAIGLFRIASASRCHIIYELNSANTRGVETRDSAAARTRRRTERAIGRGRRAPQRETVAVSIAVVIGFSVLCVLCVLCIATQASACAHSCPQFRLQQC